MGLVGCRCASSHVESRRFFADFESIHAIFAQMPFSPRSTHTCRQTSVSKPARLLSPAIEVDAQSICFQFVHQLCWLFPLLPLLSDAPSGCIVVHSLISQSLSLSLSLFLSHAVCVCVCVHHCTWMPRQDGKLEENFPVHSSNLTN